MPLSGLALAMASWEIRCRVGEDLGDALDGEELELLLAIVREAIDHQNVLGQRFPGD